jgi:hypothetical protein
MGKKKGKNNRQKPKYILYIIEFWETTEQALAHLWNFTTLRNQTEDHLDYDQTPN